MSKYFSQDQYFWKNLISFKFLILAKKRNIEPTILKKLIDHLTFYPLCFHQKLRNHEHCLWYSKSGQSYRQKSLMAKKCCKSSLFGSGSLEQGFFYLADAAVFASTSMAGQCPLLTKSVHRVIDNLLDMCLTLLQKKSFIHYKCMELYSNGDIRQSLSQR